MNRIIQEKEKYLSFQGRLSRKTFWLRLLLMYAVWQVIGAAGAYFLSAMGNQVVQGYSFGIVLTFFLCQSSLWVRRFHDRNVSGYWYGIVVFFQILTLLICIYAYALREDVLMAAGLLLLAVSLFWGLYVLICFGFLRGTKGENDYGPDPLEGQE